MPRATSKFVDAAIETVARSASPLALVAIEDLMGAKEQPNIPGTIDQHPNWRRRLPNGNPFTFPAVRHRVSSLNKARP
jgi:4-alpha-glucanotransferase